MTCDNFLTLAARGYYNGTVFHRIVKNFMVRQFDPKTGIVLRGDPFVDTRRR
jgi:peptidyl-prolyl cis-trans isomerase-like 1